METSPAASSAIKILVPPTMDFKLLPWSELFTHPNLLPEIDLMNPSSVTKSNAEIKEFLENAIVTARFNSEAHTHANTALVLSGPLLLHGMYEFFFLQAAVIQNLYLYNF